MHRPVGLGAKPVGLGPIPDKTHETYPGHGSCTDLSVKGFHLSGKGFHLSVGVLFPGKTVAGSFSASSVET